VRGDHEGHAARPPCGIVREGGQEGVGLRWDEEA
jgi:hypothetical protein